MLVAIIKYQVDWNTEINAYRVLVQYVPNTPPVLLPIDTETEFVAALLMLGKQGVMVDDVKLFLHVPARSPGT